MSIKYCKYCGKRIQMKLTVCPYCERQVEHIEKSTLQKLFPFIITKYDVATWDGARKEKNLYTAFILCVFLGWIGKHKFYSGNYFLGRVYLFTFGLGTIGWIIDAILLGFMVASSLTIGQISRKSNYARHYDANVRRRFNRRSRRLERKEKRYQMY